VAVPTGADVMLLEGLELGKSYSNSRRRGRRIIFSRVNLRINRGEIVGLTGPSGVGKTTLGNVLLGFLPPDLGQVLWQGRDVYHERARLMGDLRPRFQKLFQDPAGSFYPSQTLFESMAEVVRYHDLAPVGKATRRLIESGLPPLGLDPGILERKPHQVSGGEIQRLALARIGLLRPWFLAADEPTSRLDLSVQAQVVRLLAKWSRKHRVGLLFISHDQDLLDHICDRILFLKSGDVDSRAELVRL